MDLHAQAGMFTHHVPIVRVLQPPVGSIPPIWTLDQTVAELVKDQLRHGILWIQQLVEADQQAAVPVGGGVGGRAALHPPTDGRGRGGPDFFDVRLRQRTAQYGVLGLFACHDASVVLRVGIRPPLECGRWGLDPLALLGRTMQSSRFLAGTSSGPLAFAPERPI
jgi:hypothetical protein